MQKGGSPGDGLDCEFRLFLLNGQASVAEQTGEEQGQARTSLAAISDTYNMDHGKLKRSLFGLILDTG